MLMDYFDTYAATYRPYKDGAWCYEDGCIYRGLALLHIATGEDRWLAHLRRLVDAQVAADGTLSGYSIDEFNIDNILSGLALLYLHEKTGEERYLAGARLLARQLSQHPRTKSGVYWHKKIYPWQIWLDGLYMGLPFQIEFAGLVGEEALVDDALRQLCTALSLTREAVTGLYAHGYDESRRQQWANPETGRSPAHWARALGWLTMALVDICELIGPTQMTERSIDRDTKSLLECLLALRNTDGTWLQVIDRPELAGNYPESSATAMIAYALLKAGRLGLLDGAGVEGHASLKSLIAQKMRKGSDDVLRLTGICHVAGLGGRAGAYRDGTARYYLTEPVVEDDAKGVGPLMMAQAEAIRAGLEDAKAQEKPAPVSALRSSA